MSNIDARLRQTIERFVAELSDLVRQAALESVARAFDGDPHATPAAPARARPPAGRSAKTPRRKAPGKTKGQKRSPEALEALTRQLAEHIAANPGQRTEQIGKTLGATTAELRLPLQKLHDAGKIKTRGQKRAMKYYPA